MTIMIPTSLITVLDACMERGGGIWVHTRYKIVHCVPAFYPKNLFWLGWKSKHDSSFSFKHAMM